MVTCQRTGCCCLPPPQGSVGIYPASSLTGCVLQHFGVAALCTCWFSTPPRLAGMLLPRLLSGLQSNPSAAGNSPAGQQTPGTAESYNKFCRFLFFSACYDGSPFQSDALTMVSPCLSGGDFSGGFGSLGFPGFCGFQMAFRHFLCPSSVSH